MASRLTSVFNLPTFSNVGDLLDKGNAPTMLPAAASQEAGACGTLTNNATGDTFMVDCVPCPSGWVKYSLTGSAVCKEGCAVSNCNPTHGTCNTCMQPFDAYPAGSVPYYAANTYDLGNGAKSLLGYDSGTYTPA